MARLLVVGGGVAGCELAWGCASRGVDTQLLSTSLDTLYTLPSDRWRASPPPGTLWASLAAEAADPGDPVPGSGAPPLQRAAPLRRAVKRELERLPALRLTQANVTALALHEGRGVGVETWEGPTVAAELVVLAVGSFLQARLAMGAAREQAGRLSEMAYDELFLDLQARGVSFEGATLELEGDDATPGYRVDHQRFAAEGLEPLLFDARPLHAAAALRALPPTLALGACVAACTVEEAAAAGRDLAHALTAQLR